MQTTPKEKMNHSDEILIDAFNLPKPWKGLKFQLKPLRRLTFIVGPNGSGKSQFTLALKAAIGSQKTRILSSDRLDGFAPTIRMFGDGLASGISRSWFDDIRSSVAEMGSAIDAFVILEDRLDIQVIVEATLSSFFNREIHLEWDSGRLKPMVSSPSGERYRLDREECHGIKELMVLLTHLYNDSYQFLIIDEPELNLHPQLQAFFMEEVRKELTRSDKRIILITHSPFIIDIQNFGDLESIYSFTSDHSIPRSLTVPDEFEQQRIATLIPHLSVHHKQLFFSDNPIFVEGVSDAQFVQALESARGVSITAAGSCVIEAGGCEVVNKYLILCRHLGKSAYFLYDLDSLFSGKLRQCIQADESVSGFLAELGLGADFSKYVGALDKVLHESITKISESQSDAFRLKQFVSELGDAGTIISGTNSPIAKLAILYDLENNRQELESLLDASIVQDIAGRLSKILAALSSKRVFLLPAGTLEDYLPSHTGSHYGKKSDDIKRATVAHEIEILQKKKWTEDELSRRYTGLYANIKRLPAQKVVDYERILKRHVAEFVHMLQSEFLLNPNRSKAQIEERLHRKEQYKRVFSLVSFESKESKKFKAKIHINAGLLRLKTVVTEATNAGMQDFTLEPIPTTANSDSGDQPI